VRASKTLISVPVLAFLFALCTTAEAQQSKVARIGFLITSSPSTISPRLDAFKEGLRDLGFVEGKNFVIEYRYAEGKIELLPALAAELVRLNVDVIVTNGSPPTRAAKEATSTIPIVMTQDADPVGSRHVATLARPGGNITGLSNLSPEISAKRLELLKEIVPRLSRVAAVGTLSQSTAQQLKDTELAAKEFGLGLQYLDVQEPKDIPAALQGTMNGRAEAVLVLQSGVLNSQRKQIVEFTVKSRLPAIYYAPEWTEDGGLMSYSANIGDLFRRSATYVQRILKGAKPADLPVEQPTKFELVINLKTAKQIGVTIPPNVLARADKVIK
jgi:putative ABC transport system substrate-binding protein